jgi:energy-coupling factor transporter ATP-binding protein EcfA2
MGGDLSDWFEKQPKWLRQAANWLLEKGDLDESDLKELVRRCLQEALGSLDDVEMTLLVDTPVGIDVPTIRLGSISDVQGINALCPRVPFDLGKTNLSLVYGRNGSGKSGYVRILKHACGSRFPGPLLANIYDAEATQQQCSLTYDLKGSEITCVWKPEMGAINDLRSVDIFDASCEQAYVLAEHEVTYEPPVLAFLSDLTSVCGQVAEQLDSQISKRPSKLPMMPPLLSPTKLGAWFEALSSHTTTEEISEFCACGEDEDKRLRELGARLSEPAPTEKAKQLRVQMEHLKDLVNQLAASAESLSEEQSQRILTARIDSSLKQQAAELAAERLFADSPLAGVGSEVWNLLWEQARKYSEEQAYEGIQFPNTQQGATCVLCQQPLSEEAKVRLTDFEEFVKGGTRKEAEAAKVNLDNAIEGLAEIPEEKDLKVKTDAAGLAEMEALALADIFDGLRKRRNELLEASLEKELEPMTECTEWMAAAAKRSHEYDMQALEYEQNSNQQVVTELRSELVELRARKWLADQRQAVIDEVTRLKAIETLNSAKLLTNTHALSVEKGALSEELITHAFIRRFQGELRRLGAGVVRVELIKKRVDKGHVLHCIRLSGARADSPEYILSEGERRIVSIAAFLADVAEKENYGPFVFDDPVSSLDQEYEDAVAHRLVDLSEDRQVIVFTHRLSLLGLIEEYAHQQKYECEIVCMRCEDWGTGEPGAMPLSADKPRTALNTLRDHVLSKARKALQEEGEEAYDLIAKSICSDFRSLVERVIEHDLLSGIVKRNRRAIQTKNKLRRLALIKPEDCVFFDSMMTKYSQYEHSQPEEAPVKLPSPDELEEDLRSLKEWLEEFGTRVVD